MSNFAVSVTAEREHRLRRLLEMRAPAVIVDQEARLMLASHRGSHLRVIGWLVRELVPLFKEDDLEAEHALGEEVTNGK